MDPLAETQVRKKACEECRRLKLKCDRSVSLVFATIPALNPDRISESFLVIAACVVVALPFAPLVSPTSSSSHAARHLICYCPGTFMKGTRYSTTE